MEIKFETKVTIDGDEIYEKEEIVNDGDKVILKAAILAAIASCKDLCVTQVAAAIDEYEK